MSDQKWGPGQRGCGLHIAFSPRSVPFWEPTLQPDHKPACQRDHAHNHFSRFLFSGDGEFGGKLPWTHLQHAFCGILSSLHHSTQPMSRIEFQEGRKKNGLSSVRRTFCLSPLPSYLRTYHGKHSWIWIEAMKLFQWRRGVCLLFLLS